MLSIAFSTETDAFLGHEKRVETAKILRYIAEKISQGWTEGNVHDAGGRTVGHWKLD